MYDSEAGAVAGSFTSPQAQLFVRVEPVCSKASSSDTVRSLLLQREQCVAFWL